MADNYCVMNMSKRHRADVRGLQAEANREYDDEEKYKGNVDLTKSKDNVYLVKSGDWHKSIDEALDGAGLKENRDSVVLVTSVYDMSQDWFDSHTDDERMDYFQKCLEFERKTKGEVISAVIHKDETRWHLHVATVPIVSVQDVECVKVMEKDENGQEQVVKDKAGRPKYKRYKKFDENGQPVMHVGLSAKTVFGNKVKMSKMQTQFWKDCGEELGMVRGEIRIEDTEEAKERLTEAQHRAKKITEEADRAKEQTEQAAKVKAAEIIDEAQKQANEIIKRSKAVEEELSDAKEYMSKFKIKGMNMSDAFNVWRDAKIKAQEAQKHAQKPFGASQGTDARTVREKLLEKGREQQRRKQQQEAGQSTWKPATPKTQQTIVAQRQYKEQEPAWCIDIRKVLDAETSGDIWKILDAQDAFLSAHPDMILDEAKLKYQQYQRQQTKVDYQHDDEPFM